MPGRIIYLYKHKSGDTLKRISKKNIGKIATYIIFLLSIGFIVFIGYEYYHRFYYTLKSPEAMKRVINSYGRYGIFIFITMQILQVIAFFIPGEVFQVAGGYTYGTLLGSIISLIGITIGSTITFFLSKLCGRAFIVRLVKENKFSFANKILKLGSTNVIVFLLYLIPGMPKDVMGYICGISDITYRDFIIYSTLGRGPCILISAYFGSKLSINNLPLLVIIAFIMTFLFVLGILKGEKIFMKLFKSKNCKEKID